MNTALLSVYRRTPAFADFARKLQRHRFDLIAEGDTVAFLGTLGIPCTDLRTIIRPPPLTASDPLLAPEVLAAVQAHWSKPEDMNALVKLIIPDLKLVCLDAPPLAEALGDPIFDEEAIHALLRPGPMALLQIAAQTDCLVASTPESYEIAIVGHCMETAISNTYALGARRTLSHLATREAIQFAELAARVYEAMGRKDLPSLRKEFQSVAA